MPDAATQVYVADTIGELGTLFRLAPLAFLGKSLGIGPGTTGGQDRSRQSDSVGVITGPRQISTRSIRRCSGAMAPSLSPGCDAGGGQRLLTEPAASPR
jgi:hypothetical protein